MKIIKTKEHDPYFSFDEEGADDITLEVIHPNQTIISSRNENEYKDIINVHKNINNIDINIYNDNNTINLYNDTTTTIFNPTHSALTINLYPGSTCSIYIGAHKEYIYRLRK